MNADRGILLEFHQVGAYVKVSAMDPATLTEVSIVGAPSAGEAALRSAVLRKLRYVMERNGASRSEP